MARSVNYIACTSLLNEDPVFPHAMASEYDEEYANKPTTITEDTAHYVSDTSTNSDLTIDISSSFIVTDGTCTDFFEDYDLYPTILGTGGYAVVHECRRRQSTDGETYAVKIIDKSKIGRLDHIQREISLLRTIDHPGIMKIVDFYENSNYVFIVTERYTGGELFDMIIDNTTVNGCLPEDQAVKIIKSLLESVAYLHSHDIVHRDIKPENILLESKEEGASVKLIDFGLSRHHRKSDPPMTNRVGTTTYMSPSILRGQYDRSCDLWSVGIVSYILLTGYPPFGSSDMEVRSQVRRGLVFEDAVWGHLSKASRDFVSQLLCMEPGKERIRSAEGALGHPWITIWDQLR